MRGAEFIPNRFVPPAGVCDIPEPGHLGVQVDQPGGADDHGGVLQLGDGLGRRLHRRHRGLLLPLRQQQEAGGHGRRQRHGRNQDPRQLLLMGKSFFSISLDALDSIALPVVETREVTALTDNV